MGVTTRGMAKKEFEARELHFAAIAFALEGAIDKKSRLKHENQTRAAISYWHKKKEGKYSFGGLLSPLGLDDFKEDLHQLRFISHILETVPASPTTGLMRM